jgi:succinyl-CoA synthetase beta subunit
MRLREYQAKAILTEYELAVPRGQLVHSVDQVAGALATLGEAVVLKAQVPVGGRGKAGGIRFADSLAQAEDAARSLLGVRIKGHCVTEILVEERLAIWAEYYVAIITDTNAACPVVMVSARGGMDIEQVAREEPEAIVRLSVDPYSGLGDGEARSLTKQARLADPIADWLETLYRIYWECDAQLVEINPLVATRDGRLVAADARMVIDDNALFRQPKIQPWREITPDEARAEAAHINYLALDGTIGIIGTGAGMAMANMDQVAYFGGQPANFMDVGPGVNTGGGRAAMEILLSRPELKTILVSGYSGARLEILAQDIVAALAAHPETCIPIVVRLQGTNDGEALDTIRKCPYPNLRLSQGFDDAARLVVQLSKQR